MNPDDVKELVPSAVTPTDVILALLVVLACWIASRWVRRGALALMHRAPGITEASADFVARFASYSVVLFGIAFGLVFLGANTQPLLAMVIILAVIAVLVLRGVAENFAAGLLLQVRHAVDLESVICVEGPEDPLTGTVIELNSRAVVIQTFDGRTVHVPNATLLRDPLINDSAYGSRRSEVQVRVERDSRPVDDLLPGLSDVVASVDGVLTETPPRALATTISADRIVARVQFWHLPLGRTVVTGDVVVALGAALEADGWVSTVTSVLPEPPLTPPDGI